MSKTFSFLLVLFASSLLLFAMHSHAPQDVHWYPPCLFKKLTNLDCPGCGGTRAGYNLLHGNLEKAANHNLLLLILLPVSITGVGAIFSKSLKRAWKYFNKPFVILMMVLFFWLIRNLPFFPFEWLHSDK